MNNEHVLVSGSRLCLVPYLPQHVLRYHQWMNDDELLQNTASEPVTLDEEYANQREWLCARDKLTFILLAPLSVMVGRGKDEKTAVEGHRNDRAVHCTSDDMGCDVVAAEEEANRCCGSALPNEVHTHVPHMAPHSCDRSSSRLKEASQINHAYIMIGDCNLFQLGDDEADEEVSTTSGAAAAAAAVASTKGQCFEVAVMVADRAARGFGFGEAAVRLLMSYALDKLNASCFIAKILKDNTPSVRLFAEKLGFTFLKEVPVFGEVHYCKRFDPVSKKAWSDAAGYKVGVYDEATERGMRILHALP